MSDCERVGKWIGGCRFEARYDEGAPDLSGGLEMKSGNPAPFLLALRPKTYIHDICTRCGKVVTRPTTPKDQ